MRFDEQTIKILSNYATINRSIFFHPGNILSTIAPTRSILARAKMKDNIPRQFAIHDLTKLLNVLRLFQEPELDIEKDKVSEDDEVLVIKEGARTAHFTLAAPELIVQPPPPDKEIKFAPSLTFSLTAPVVKELKAASSSFSHTELVFRNVRGKIMVETTNVTSPTSDRFMVAVGETNKKFSVAIKATNFVVMDADYHAEVSFFKLKDKQKASLHLFNDEIEYFLAIESKQMEVARED